MTTTTFQPVASADPKWWDCPTLDTAAHIAESLGEPLTLPDHIDGDGWVSEAEDALCRWFARLTHQQYEHVHRDNVYNHENDFSSQFVFSVFAPVDRSEWLYSDDVFITVERHLGGDVRGNYSSFQVFRVDSIADSGFLDWVCGWRAEPIRSESSSDLLALLEDSELSAANDRLSIGYSSHPTSELRSLLWQGTEPVWSERHGCYVARLADVPFAVKLHPTEPCYGG